MAMNALMAIGSMIPSVSRLISDKWGQKRNAESEAAWQNEFVKQAVSLDSPERRQTSIGEFGQTPSGRVSTIGSSPGNTQASRERTAASTGRMFNTPTSFFGEPTAPVDFGQSAGGGAPMMPTRRPLTQTPMQPAQPNYLAPPQTNIAQAQPTANSRQFIPMIDMPPPQELKNIPNPVPVIDSVLSGGAATPSMPPPSMNETPPPRPILPPPSMNEVPSASGGPLSQDELGRVSAYGASVAPSQQSQGQIEDAFTDPRNPLGPGAKPYIEEDIEGINRLNQARANIVSKYGELTPRQEADYGARLSRLSGTGPEERVTVQNETGYRTTVPQRNIQYLNQGWSLADATSQIKKPTAKEAPEIVELYDDNGAYNAMWDSDLGKYVRMGGTKPRTIGDRVNELGITVPANYMPTFPDGAEYPTMVPIPGSEADPKVIEVNRVAALAKAKPAANKAYTTVMRQLDAIDGLAKTIINDPNTNDVVGSYEGRWFNPNQLLGDSNATAASNIRTFENNLQLRGMQAIREASPTGSAGGQVSEVEWPKFSSQFGNIERIQDEDTFIANITQIKADMNQLRAELTRAYVDDYGEEFVPATTDPDKTQQIGNYTVKKVE